MAESPPLGDPLPRPEQVPAGQVPPRKVRFLTPRRSLYLTVGAVIAALVMVLTAFSPVAHASSSPTPVVLDLAPLDVGIDQPFTLHANVSDGIVQSSVQGSFTGYQLWWFFGETNATGALDVANQSYPVPTLPLGCTVDHACPTDVPISVSHTYTSPGSYDLSLTVYDAAGDYTIATDVVNVLPPTMSVTGLSNTRTAAEDQPVGFSAAASLEPSSYQTDRVLYQWNFGDGNQSWGQVVTHAYDQSGSYQPYVTAYDNRTDARARFWLPAITITNPPPVAVLTGATHGVEDLPVSFSGASSRDVPSDLPLLTFHWSFGDGTEGAGKNVSHIYTEAGRYPVTLTVSDEEGLTSTAQQYVYISDPLPQAHAGPTLTVPVGQVAFLDGNASTDVAPDYPLLNYTWSSAPTTTFGAIGRTQYFTPGNYSNDLQLRSDSGQKVSAATDVSVHDVAPSVGFFAAYTKANLTFLVTGLYGVRISLLENGQAIRNATVEALPAGNNVLTWTGVELEIANQYELQFQWLPGNPPGGETGLDVLLQFWGSPAQCAPPGINAPSRCDEVYTTSFSPSTLPVDLLDLNEASVGQTVYLIAQAFSPAQTPLTVTMDFPTGPRVFEIPAPTLPEPTLGTVQTSYAWNPSVFTSGTLLVATVSDAFGLSNQSVLFLSTAGSLGVNGLAPLVSIAPLTNVTELSPALFEGNLTYNDLAAPFADVRWWFGDGGIGFGQALFHEYQYGATRYAAIVAARGIDGLTTYNWTWVPVANPPPFPSFSASTYSTEEFVPITFNATASYDVPGDTQLSYAWSFGDGPNFGNGSVVNYTYTREGTFPVTLTVTDEEGASSSLTQWVTITDQVPTVSISNRTVYVDTFSATTPTVVTASPGDLPLLKAVWSWGDGTTSSGLESGHTYLKPGTYPVHVTVTDPDGNSGSSNTAYFTVKDLPLVVSLPYAGATVYGENHTAPFTATVLGSLADEAFGSSGFHYLWGFGDQSPPTAASSGLTDTVGHVYTVEGNPVLSVSVTSPYGSTGSAQATLILVPDSDGDGIPNLYAQAVLHINPYNPDVSNSGLTNYLKYFVLGGNLTNADTTGAGLTDFQQVFGTVTGYVTNPMDPNQAGLALRNGQFLWGNVFQTSNVAPLPTFQPIDSPSAPVYRGNPAAFNQTELVVEILSPNLSGVIVQLYVPGLPQPLTLPKPTSPVMTYYLLNNTPVGGASSPYGLTVSQLTSGAPWEVAVIGNGTLQMAEVVFRYWTNPGLADPTASGMIVGPTVTTPLFNYSEPTNSNFTEFNPDTFTYSTVDYYPYTETYYKLSAIQGIPYYPSYNQSTGEPQATYYGDSDFGIVPWNAHAAGDSALTNGMKALGKTVYQETANLYEEPGGNVVGSQMQVYTNDPISTYYGPLNPTAYSTSGSGVADSQAADPIQYIVGAFSINQVVDYGCSQALVDSNAANVQIAIPSAAGSPSIYTPVASGTGSSQPVGCTTPWQKDTTFNFNDYYTIPINQFNSYPVYSSHFQSSYQNEINPQLWYGDRLNGGSSDTSFELWWNNSFSIGSGVLQTVWNPNSSVSINGGDWTFGRQIEALPRVNAILVAQQNETTQVPGYGLRYHGEDQFYVFNLNIASGASGPFVNGFNTIIESRASFLHSPLNDSLVSRANFPSCANNSNLQVSVRGSGSSQALIAGGFNGTVSGSCALTLLNDLLPQNRSGGPTDGSYTQLNALAFELSGLPGSLDPYETLAGYNSPQTGGAIPDAGQAILNIINEAIGFFVGIVLAVVNFFVQLAEEIGQAILGAINAVIQAVVSAVEAVISALEWLLNYVANLAKEALNAVKNFFVSAFHAVNQVIVYPYLSLMYDTGALSIGQYDHDMNVTTGSDTPALSKSTAVNDIFNQIYALIGIIAAVFVIVGVVSYILAIVTAGAYEAAEQATEDSMTASITAAISGLVAIGSAAFSVLSEVSGTIGNILSGQNASSGLTSVFEEMGIATNYASQAASLLSGLLLPFLKFLTLEFDSFDFIAGGSMEIIAIVLAVLGDTLTEPIAQVVVGGLALVFAVVSLIVTIAGPSDITNDVANTQLAQIGLVAAGIAGIGAAAAAVGNGVENLTGG